MAEYKPTAWFGGLLALTMGVAFLAEVLMLPATIKLLPRWFSADALRRGAVTTAAIIFAGVLAKPAFADPVPLPHGHVSLFADYMPNRSSTRELRARVFVEEKIEPSSRILIVASAFAEGLTARRPTASGGGAVDAGATSVVTDAAWRAHDAYIEVTGGKLQFQAGLARVVWGRLDEIQPTDVVNPLDVSRFFFDGRSDARLPVALIRGKLFFNEDTALEAIYTPVFRRGRFDQLDEPSSPFNLTAGLAADTVVCLAIGCPVLPPVVIDTKPRAEPGNAQGGARFTATTRRVDWSVSAYRGFESFALYEPAITDGGRLVLRGSHPRFTMVGGDFEAVKGAWGLRGEAAVFVEDNFQSASLRIVDGTSLDAGLGVDRKAGNYRISGTILVHRETYDEPLVAAGGESGRSDVSFVVSADRSFARERHRLRVFAVADTPEGSGFARAILTSELRDNVAIEGSAGWFAGTGRDLVGRFSDSDFVYVRLKYYF
jgi:hypothetical protein